MKIAKAQQEETKLAFQQALLNAGAEVNNALTRCQSARAKTGLRTQQIEALERAVESTELLMQHGSTTYLEVLTAQQSLLSAQLNADCGSFRRDPGYREPLPGSGWRTRHRSGGEIMKRGATKEEIIRITQELITRNGIRAVRVDEIAQTLGISKRTLYEMFADKEDLVSACLDFMCHQQQERITAYRKRRSRSSLQRAFKLVYEYIEHLYTVESSFLSDLRHKVAYAEHFDEHREFWRSELTAHLRGSREEKLLLPEIDADSFADRILETIFEMRINNATREESYLFCRTILRGAATREGVERIDSHR